MQRQRLIICVAMLLLIAFYIKFWNDNPLKVI